MFSQLLEPDGLLTDAYRGLIAAKPLGYVVKPENLAAEYEHGWCVARNVRMMDLAEFYADRFFALLSRLDILDTILERLDRIDQDYEQLVVSAEQSEDDTETARTSAMCLLVMLFRRLEARGEVKLLDLGEVAVWLNQHVRLLGDKRGQLALF